MLLKDIFEYLAHGEMSQLYLGTSNEGRIAEADYPKVVSHINLALLDLYTYFPIKENELVFEQIEGKFHYLLHNKHAESNEDSTEIKFIKDSTVDPFINDILKIEEVYRTDNVKLPLNDLENKRSAFTPAFNVVQLVDVYPSELVSVVYQARHPKIVVPRDNNIDDVQIELPEALVEPLLVYVHGRLAANNGSENSLNESLMLKQQYIAMIQDFRNREIINRDTPTNIKMRDNGWV